MNRKLRKLIKSPRLYFVDMFKKKLAKGTLPIKYLPRFRVKGVHKFSVVSAVYGVESYLEQYFSSIENQTLNFVDHIELIMVDDGSLDNSAEIINKWVNKYPNNIKYVKKENGGQASARNLGMEYVTNNWVTFIDPDDFVDINYFLEVDKFLNKEKNIALVSCNFIFYIENKDILSDTHPLRHRFEENETVLDIDELKNHIQLNVNSAFFKVDLVCKHKLIMKTDIEPTFEDGHFVGKYLLSVNEMNIGFIKNAKYYYRKREDSSSSIDKSWNSRDQYTTKLKNGYLDLFHYAKAKKGYIPENIQRTVFYDVMWYLKHIINHDERLAFLEIQDRNKFIKLLNEIFTFIDSKVIDDFYLAGCWFYHKVGILGAFKGEKPPIQIAYLDDFDKEKKLIKLKYFYFGELPLESITLDDEDRIPVYSKTRLHDFLGEAFVYERYIWLKVNNDTKTLRVNINNTKARISIEGKHYHNGLSTETIFDQFKKNSFHEDRLPILIGNLKSKAKSPDSVSKFRDAWLLMDRDTQADDNAEHLYRYIKEHNKKVNAYFVLRKNSHDWQRLENEGFKLLDFNSEAHKLALLNANHVISSHADHYVVSLLEEKWFADLLNFRFTFLQHGITKDDLSNWLNNKPIDFFITATPEEYKSIAGDNNRYKYSEREVSLTGFARHDGLLKLNTKVDTEKLIVIMPTWRQGIVGATVGKGNDREVNDEFYSSEYAQAWKSVLHSNKLKELSSAFGYEVAFFPHANVQPYMDWFETPDYITKLSHSNIVSIQHLFCRSSLMITDYSSVAFEMAYIEKAVIYYQFDYEFVFGGGHLTNKGYFNYENDGFGPVVRNERDLLTSLSEFFENGSKLADIYRDRIKDTFVRRDGNCCMRIYEGIKRLGRKNISKINKLHTAKRYAEDAMRAKNYLLASQRWAYLFKDPNLEEANLKEVGVALIASCRKDGRLGEASNWIHALKDKLKEFNQGNKHLVNIEKARLIIAYYQWDYAFRTLEEAHSLMGKQQWSNAFKYWDKITSDLSSQIYIDSVLYKIECLAQEKKWQEISKCITSLNGYNLSEEELFLLEGWQFAYLGEWDKTLNSFDSITKSQGHDFMDKNKTLIFLEKGDYSNYLHLLDRVGEIQTNGHSLYFESINSAVKELSEGIHYLKKSEPGFSEREASELIDALKYYKLNNEAKIVSNNMFNNAQ